MFDTTQLDLAKADGWKLVTTFDNGDTHPVWDIAAHGAKFSSDRAAAVAVVDAARRGGTLHQQALKLVAESRLRTPSKGKKK